MNQAEENIVNVIKTAIWVDRRLPKTGPKSAGCLLGRLMVIPDERGADDYLADRYQGIDLPEDVGIDDMEVWYQVMTVWLPCLSFVERRVVLKKLGGMGWKRLCHEERMSRATGWRILTGAIKKIMGCLERYGIRVNE